MNPLLHSYSKLGSARPAGLPKVGCLLAEKVVSLSLRPKGPRNDKQVNRKLAVIWVPYKVSVVNIFDWPGFS